MALEWAPLGVSQNSQAFRPTTKGRMAFSENYWRCPLHLRLKTRLDIATGFLRMSLPRQVCCPEQAPAFQARARVVQSQQDSKIVRPGYAPAGAVVLHPVPVFVNVVIPLLSQRKVHTMGHEMR